MRVVRTLMITALAILTFARLSRAAQATATPYEITELFEVLIGDEQGTGLPSFRIPRQLASSDTVRLSSTWGSDGNVYLRADFQIYQGMRPAPEYLKQWLPPEVPDLRPEVEVYKLSRAGQLLAQWKGASAPRPEPLDLVSPTPIDPARLEWFKNTLGDLPEYADRRYKATWREGNVVKEHWDNPVFFAGALLGTSSAGHSVYLMEIEVRKRVQVGASHGLVDQIPRVYVIDKQDRVVFSAESWPSIRLHQSTGFLYETQLPADGRRVLRIWEPK